VSDASVASFQQSETDVNATLSRELEAFEQLAENVGLIRYVQLKSEEKVDTRAPTNEASPDVNIVSEAGVDGACNEMECENIIIPTNSPAILQIRTISTPPRSIQLDSGSQVFYTHTHSLSSASTQCARHDRNVGGPSAESKNIDAFMKADGFHPEESLCDLQEQDIETAVLPGSSPVLSSAERIYQQDASPSARITSVSTSMEFDWTCRHGSQPIHLALGSLFYEDSPYSPYSPTGVRSRTSLTLENNGQASCDTAGPPGRSWDEETTNKELASQKVFTCAG
jgi:hypothetical protein